ncbi:NUDIX domain-containing protein [Marivirga atlantica]|jgi:8-oxo-dGTP diphosphatase|uniref:NUDIX hydrolase n=1 Tax=Marivirga atlantica TaxID=1548457 RepID=A0A937DE06_9BACT|nr:NUDIX domain-containing protein [Marivirga atlantica]MBL0764762.1 NUDIX hydrolase [Marivirga atlantica]
MATFHYNPHISVDCVIFGFDDEKINILLIKRKQIDKKVYALPGDLVKKGEDLDVAAARILSELTGLSNVYQEQFKTFGSPDRIQDPADIEWLKSIREHPEARVITVGYNAIIKTNDFEIHASSFAEEVMWHPIEKPQKLAFDHNDIANTGWAMLREKIKREPIVAFNLLPKKFTLRQLQTLYEAIVGNELDKRNFRKRMLRNKFIVPLDEKEQNVSHKPAQYFAFDKEIYKEDFAKDQWFLF